MLEFCYCSVLLGKGLVKIEIAGAIGYEIIIIGGFRVKRRINSIYAGGTKGSGWQTLYGGEFIIGLCVISSVVLLEAITVTGSEKSLRCHLCHQR